MSCLHIPLANERACETTIQPLPQPNEHHRHRQVTQPITSTTSSKQDYSSRGPVSQASTLPHQVSPEQPATTTSHLRFHRKLRLHPGPPPLRDLPILRQAGEEIHSRCTLVAANQLEEISADIETVSPESDYSFGSPYGFLYGFALPHAMQERASALADAEEAEYQSKRAWKRVSRSTGRVGTMLKSMSRGSSPLRARTGFQ